MSHQRARAKLQIAILPLVAALFIAYAPPSFGSIASNKTIASTGEIAVSPPPGFTILLGAGHPGWSNDPNGNPVDIQALVNLVADTGANCWREAMYIFSTVPGYHASLKSYCDQRGLKFIIQTLSPANSYGTYQDELDIIMNNTGQQDTWINGWGSIIQQLQPYAIMVMNEPSNDGTFTTASATAFGYYRQFCINSINAWRQIKPDLVIIVQNDPFNDLFDSTTYGFAANPLPFSNIIYTRHEYYSYDNAYPPNYKPEQQAYWNATTDQGLANAKQLLATHINSESLALRNKDQQVMWDEWGANLQAPHATNYTQDFITICKSLNIGAVYYDIVPWGYGTAQESTGLLNNDYKTFNAVGQAWAANMPRS
jgi:hypothetical protein